MEPNHCPNYLSDYRDLHAKDPHAANLKWFAEANYGLFLHYGLYSQLGRHEWAMWNERIPVAEYEKLAESFDPSGFDADFITDLACEAGMKYVNLTTYAIIRSNRPEALISFKQGATGTEDYASPEFHFISQGDELRKQGKEAAAEIADKAWTANKVKHNEICMTLQNGSWGWHKERSWKGADEIWSCLAYARAHNCNLLANIGPRPDGSIPEEAAGVVREVGRRIAAEGLPTADQAAEPQRLSGGTVVE